MAFEVKMPQLGLTMKFSENSKENADLRYCRMRIQKTQSLVQEYGTYIR